MHYRFPLTTAVHCRSMATQDSEYGFYRGRRDPDEDIARLEKDSFEAETRVGSAEFAESYGIHDVNSKPTRLAKVLI